MTEWISGVNIPSCQLMIGMGVPLHRIPDIRRLFGKDPKGTAPIDFEGDAQIPPSGACLCSLYLDALRRSTFCGLASWYEVCCSLEGHSPRNLQAGRLGSQTCAVM